MMVFMPTPLHPLWRPKNEAELEAALNDGTFAESHYRDAKEKTKKPRAYAADMASFAVDGGLLVIGVREDKDTGEFFLAPFEYEDQVCEGVERVALTLCDPPLPVTVEWMPSVLESGKGYLLVEVPRSSLAPHQVDGVYYGRGDKTKKRLSDPEVERLLLARDASLSGVREMLEELVESASAPFLAQEEDVSGGLHVVARPVARQHRMFVEWTHGVGWHGRLHGLLDAAVKPVNGLAPRKPPRLDYPFRTAGGAGLSSRWGVFQQEDGAVRFAVLEGGGAWFQDFRATAFVGRLVKAESRETASFRVVYDDLFTGYVWTFLRAICELSQQAGYRGSWDIGVAVTDLGNGVARSIIPDGLDEDDISEINHYDHSYYEAATRASLTELEKSPQLVMDQLLGPLLRTLGSSSEVTRFVEVDSTGS